MNALAVPVVDVKDLVVTFGDFVAVDHVSFSVNEGEIFGFLGANGAGKTTTIRVLCGLLVPTSGEARIAGRRFEDGVDAIKSEVGYMSQRFTLYTDLTVQENLEFAAALRKLDRATLARRTEELFRFIGFTNDRSTLVRDLPGGLKQELSLAAALLHDPRIVFLDEPTAGVSPVSRVRFWSLIRRLANAGKTIFVTTHYMDEAEQCGRIALMRAGSIIALDSPAALKRSTYPEPLFELEAADHADTGWLPDFAAAAAGEIQPYGMRYHAAITDSPAFEWLVKKWDGRVHARHITPSLEDVFIRLVEGKNR